MTAEAESLLELELERIRDMGRAGVDRMDRMRFSSAPDNALSSICGVVVDNAIAAAAITVTVDAVVDTETETAAAAVVVDVEVEIEVDLSLLALPSSLFLDFFFLSLLDFDFPGLF